MAENLDRQENPRKDYCQVVVALILASLGALVLGYAKGRLWSAALAVVTLLGIIFTMWVILSYSLQNAEACDPKISISEMHLPF